jgi:hypothetical protein
MIVNKISLSLNMHLLEKHKNAQILEIVVTLLVQLEKGDHLSSTILQDTQCYQPTCPIGS